MPWHWICGVTLARQATGRDGHLARRRFLSPVSQPRRMWASSRISATRPLEIGSAETHASTIDAIKERQGKRGRLVFVTVGHEWARSGASGNALDEWQDIAYRDIAKRRLGEQSNAMSARAKSAA